MRRTFRIAILQFRDLQECNPAAIYLLSGPQEPSTPSTNHPLPHTPPARIRHQTQLPRNRQRSPILPRSTVERNPARRPHRQCPRRRHLRTEPASTVFRCRLQPGLCRRVRAPSTEADTHRGCPSSTTATTGERPGISAAVHPEKWRASNRTSFTRDGGIRLFNCFGESKRRPRVYFSPGQRPVLFRMHWSVAEVRNRRLFRGQDRQAPPRPPAAGPPSQPRRNSSCRESARTVVLDPGPAHVSQGYARRYQARTECAGECLVCSQDNRSRVTIARQLHYLHKSTERSRSRIWIVSESVSTSLQPSQSTHTYSTQM